MGDYRALDIAGLQGAPNINVVVGEEAHTKWPATSRPHRARRS